MITRYIKDSITNHSGKYIAHGVNCQNAMGSGVARVLFEKWPMVKEEYHIFCATKFKPEELLGLSQFVQINPPVLGPDVKYVINCFTQLEYGKDGKRYVDYFKTANIFARLSYKVDIRNNVIAIPRIGCGLAGGNWNTMEAILNDATKDRLELWVYDPELK